MSSGTEQMNEREKKIYNTSRKYAARQRIHRAKNNERNQGNKTILEWIKIEQNRRSKLKRFNNDKIATKSGATDFAYETLSSAREGDRKRERERAQSCSHYEFVVVVVFITVFDYFTLCSTCSNFVTLFQTFQLHCECVRLISFCMQLLVHVNLPIESNKSIERASKWNTIFAWCRFLASFCLPENLFTLTTSVWFRWDIILFLFITFLLRFLFISMQSMKVFILCIYELWLMKF